MRYLLATMLLLGSIFAVVSVVSAGEPANAPAAEVKEIYEYCLSIQEEKEDKQLLNCVNEELSASDYATFATLEALLAYIKQADTNAF